MIEVNGRFYEEREKPQSKPISRSMAAIMAMAAAMPYINYYEPGQSTYSRPFPNVNIIEEFGKIERKESKLPKAERDMVVRAFNNKFKQAEK